MKDILSLILDNLSALKRDGFESVSVNDETLKKLKAAVENSKILGEPVSVPAPAPKIETRSRKIETPTNDVPAAQKRVPAMKVPVLPVIKTQAEFEEVVKKDALSQKHASVGKKWLLGHGSIPAKLLICGDMPSAEDEANGRIFSDASGTMLEKIIAAMGVPADEIFYTNFFKWRTEASMFAQKPGLEEATAAYCEPFFKAQVEFIKPQLIVAMGALPAHFFSKKYDAKMGELRGNVFEFCGVKVLTTYHPNYLVRSGSMQSKRALWEDMIKAMEFLGVPVSEKQRNYFLPKN